MLSSNFCIDLTLPKYAKLDSEYVRNNISKCGEYIATENTRSQTPTCTAWDGIALFYFCWVFFKKSYDITDTKRIWKNVFFNTGILFDVEY